MKSKMITKSLNIDPLKADDIDIEPAEKEHLALGPLRQGTTYSLHVLHTAISYIRGHS
jgi:hypothetical protein